MVYSSSDRNNEFRLVLAKVSKEQQFGFSVAGGADSVLPVVISEIKTGSVADKCGQLEVGDVLVEANGLNLLENNLSTLEVSRYLQAQPNLTLELKIKKDPIIRRKAANILRDPNDFETISCAVSPDNLQSLKSLTIQSGHTHQVKHSYNRSSTLNCAGRRRNFVATSSRYDPWLTYAQPDFVDLNSPSVESSKFDWSSESCVPGYATIRRTPTWDRRQNNKVLTKSMPTDVDLIGSERYIDASDEVISQSAAVDKSPHKTIHFSHNGSSSVSPSKSSPQNNNALFSLKVETGTGVANLKLNDSPVKSTPLPEVESRSLSPEIKEAIACADPSSCWADYFPENLTLTSSSSLNSQQQHQTSNETTVQTIHDSATVIFQTPGNSPTGILDSESALTPTSNAPNVSESSFTTPNMHNKSLNDSFTDDEISPLQQTQHFNSPVLGATQRPLFFDSDNFTFPFNNISTNNTSSDASPNTKDNIVNQYSGHTGTTCADSFHHPLPNSKVRTSRGPRRDSFENRNPDQDEDEDDGLSGKCYILESLEIAAPPPPKPAPEVDIAAARRLASRLFYLNGFDRTDVPKHLGKKQDFSQAVAAEYFKFYDFTDERIDESLRKFFSNLVLYGDTQERERILSHFSKRYFDCNPTLFPSFESVDYLVTAVVLLNQDLNAIRVGGNRNVMGMNNKPMTVDQFITNVITKPPLPPSQMAMMGAVGGGGGCYSSPLQNEPINEEYSEYSRELLIDLYNSVREEPLICTVCPMPPQHANASLAAYTDIVNGGQIHNYPDVYYNDGSDMHGSLNSANYLISEDGSAYPNQESGVHFNGNSLVNGGGSGNNTSVISAAGFVTHLPSISGYLSRKWLFETDLKKTGKLKRSWKQWYVTLRGLDLIHHKSHDEAVKSGGGGEQKALVLSIHHALALPVNGQQHLTATSLSSIPAANDNNTSNSSIDQLDSSATSVSSFKSSSSSSTKDLSSKKNANRWDFVVRTADWAEYQYRCRSKQEMEDWIMTINLVAAHSAPPMIHQPQTHNQTTTTTGSNGCLSPNNPTAASNSTSNSNLQFNTPTDYPSPSPPPAPSQSSSSTLSFQNRHYKPHSFTPLKLQDQISLWGAWVNSSEMAHSEAMRKHANLPTSTSKSVLHSAEHEIVYFEFEVQRYQIYQEALIESINNSRSSYNIVPTFNNYPPNSQMVNMNMNTSVENQQQHHHRLQPFSNTETPSINIYTSSSSPSPSTCNANDVTQSSEQNSTTHTTPIAVHTQIPQLFPSRKPNLSSKAVDYGVL